jgi:trigger factor
MKVNKMTQKGFTVTLEIEEDYAAINSHMDEAFKEVAKEAKIDGFRPGKIPREVFEKKFGKEVIIESAANIAMNKAYQAAIADKKLEPVDYPRNVELKKLKENEPLVFTLDVDVIPEVKLGKYKGVKVDKKETVIGDAEIQKQLEHLQENYAEYILVEGRGVQDGDIIGCDIKAFIDDKPLEKLTKMNSGTKVGSGYLSPDFDKALLGLKAAETKEFTVIFKADHPEKELAGNTVKFNVLINEIREKKLPELNDELAKKVSPFQTLSALKEDIKTKMQKQAGERDDAEFKDNLIREILKDCTVDLPDALIEHEISKMLNNLQYSLAQSRLDLDKYLEMIGKDLKGLREEMRPKAVERAKSELVLKAIADKEKLEVAEKDMDAELTEIAKGIKGQTIEESKAKVSESTKEYVKAYLLDKKTLDFLAENAKITKKGP